MYLILLTFAPTSVVPTDERDANLVTDALWAVTDPTEQLEHISAKADLDRLSIGLFYNAPTEREALGRARQLCGRAANVSRRLEAWALTNATSAHQRTIDER